MIGVLFGGEVPRPASGRSWKQHAYDFDAGQWRELIRERDGRLLLCMSSNCTASCPSYFGVPPPCPSDPPLFTVRVPYFGFQLPVHLEHLIGSRPTSYGVFDVTDFAKHHPGGRDLLVDAALDNDCTERFDSVQHTERARQILRGLAVPGLAEVPIPPPLVRPPPSLPVRFAAWAVAVLKHARAIPHRTLLYGVGHKRQTRRGAWHPLCRLHLLFPRWCGALGSHTTASQASDRDRRYSHTK